MDTTKKSIMIVTRNFPPLVGGMERLMKHTYRELTTSYDVHFVGPEGAKNFIQPGTVVVECPLYPTPLFLASCQFNTLKLARKTRPRLIFSGSGVTAPAAYSASRVFRVPVVCYLHGIDIIVNSFVYKRIFLPAIRKADLIIVNSHNTARLARSAGITQSPIHILHPGITLPSPHLLDSEGTEFRYLTRTENKKVLLSVGRLTARKGLIQFITHCLPKIIAQRPEVVLVIIGGEARNALKKSVTTHQAILTAARSASMENHVRVVGHVSDEILSQAYASSDLHVFPVLDLPGDIEGFGAVAVEAASHGLFTAAFASGGVPDAVEHNVSGYLIEPGNYEQLNLTILEHLNRKVIDRQRAQCIDFARQFTWEHFGERLNCLFSGLL